jgi:hypothetical protein
VRKGGSLGDMPQNWTQWKLDIFRTVNPLSWVQIILYFFISAYYEYYVLFVLLEMNQWYKICVCTLIRLQFCRMSPREPPFLKFYLEYVPSNSILFGNQETPIYQLRWRLDDIKTLCGELRNNVNGENILGINSNRLASIKDSR